MAAPSRIVQHAIVGGGVIGASSLYHVVRRMRDAGAGGSVCLIERDPAGLASGSTAKSAGLVLVNAHAAPISRHMALRTIADMAEMRDEFGMQIDYHQVGSLKGDSHEVLDGMVDANQLTHCYHSAARAMADQSGGEIVVETLLGHNVHGVQRGTGTVELDLRPVDRNASSQEDVSVVTATSVINATGPAADRLCRHPISFALLRSQYWEFLTAGAPLPASQPVVVLPDAY